MKTAIKLTVIGALIVFIGYWLRGHDVLTAFALLALCLVMMARLGFAIFHRHRRLPPEGPDSASKPAHRPPGGRPPQLAAAVETKV
jgi:hypothetical protein